MKRQQQIDMLRSLADDLQRDDVKTPTAFNWTPAMSAIWPADYRPTMSGLLAIWSAMHEAAQYDTPKPVEDEDGWIGRFPGDAKPVGMVEFECADEYRSTGTIPQYWWDGTGCAGDQIVKWRPAK